MHGKEWGASPLLAAPRVLLQGAAPTFLTSQPPPFPRIPIPSDNTPIPSDNCTCRFDSRPVKMRLKEFHMYCYDAPVLVFICRGTAFRMRAFMVLVVQLSRMVGVCVCVFFV